MASDELSKEGFDALLFALASLSPHITRSHPSMLLAYNIARLLRASEHFGNEQDWAQAIILHLYAYGQWNLSVADYGAANATAARRAFDEVLSWPVENAKEAEMRDETRKLRSRTLKLLRALRIERNRPPARYIAEVPLTKRHSAACFLAILAFRKGKQDDLLLTEASDFHMIGACRKRPKKECRDMLGEPTMSWLGGPEHRTTPQVARQLGSMLKSVPR